MYAIRQLPSIRLSPVSSPYCSKAAHASNCERLPAGIACTPGNVHTLHPDPITIPLPSRETPMKSRLQLALLCMLATVGSVGLFSSCAPNNDMDATAKALIKLDDDWSKAAATKNADSVASFYAADAIAYPPNERVATG